MNFKIGNYIENEIKKNNLTKSGLYSQLKDVFYKKDKENYVSYKGFASKFYTKFYAEELLKISYLLNIDLNKMRDEIISLNGNNREKILEIALCKSKYAENCTKEYAKWFIEEDGFVYIIWFKLIDVINLEYIVEMYDINKNILTDITFLTCKAIMVMDRKWKSKTLEERLHAIKLYNKRVYDELND